MGRRSAADATFRTDSTAAFDWGRRRVAHLLRPRGFGDVDSEAYGGGLLSTFGSRERPAPTIDAAAHIFERGFPGASAALTSGSQSAREDRDANRGSGCFERPGSLHRSGLAQRGGQVALLARRRSLLDDAAKEAGPAGDPVRRHRRGLVPGRRGRGGGGLGGIDALVYAPGIGPLAKLVDTDAETWRRVFDTNVTGASLVTAAAISHLTESAGAAIYLSSVSASNTPPWPGLGPMRSARRRWRSWWTPGGPSTGVGFTRLVVGDCAGGDGDGMTQFANGWDPDVVAEVYPIWAARQYLSGTIMDVERLVGMVHAVFSVPVPSITVAPGRCTTRSP